MQLASISRSVWSHSLPTPCTVAGLAPLTMAFPRQMLEWVAMLQGIFLTQGQNLGLLHCRQILHHLSHQQSPISNITVYSYGGEKFPGLPSANWNISQ